MTPKAKPKILPDFTSSATKHSSESSLKRDSNSSTFYALYVKGKCDGVKSFSPKCQTSERSSKVICRISIRVRFFFTGFVFLSVFSVGDIFFLVLIWKNEI